MFILRDISKILSDSSAWVQIVLGPRQCGKSTLLASLNSKIEEINFDDLHLRQLANNDPNLFFEQFSPPLLLDEVQYTPNIFPEIKKRVDILKRQHLTAKIKPPLMLPLFHLTGSNQILMDKNINESLAGRASYYYMNTLTVHEILQALPQTSLKDILFKGGWPELYNDQNISPTVYLNDYIRSYVEKDIVMGAGIQKISEFHTILILLAARTSQLVDYANIAKDSGISAVTAKEWTSLLERSHLVYLLKPYSSNINKRLTKSPKLYFLDTGMAARLQGWPDATPMINSPQIGGLFESLVFAEIIKFIQNYRKDWQIFFWRTKEGEEIDFLIKTEKNEMHAFDAKLSLAGKPKEKSFPASFKKTCLPNHPLIIVTFAGQKLQLTHDCISLPISDLHDYLQKL